MIDLAALAVGARQHGRRPTVLGYLFETCRGLLGREDDGTALAPRGAEHASCAELQKILDGAAVDRGLPQHELSNKTDPLPIGFEEHVEWKMRPGERHGLELVEGPHEQLPAVVSNVGDMRTIRGDRLCRGRPRTRSTAPTPQLPRGQRGERPDGSGAIPSCLRRLRPRTSRQQPRGRPGAASPRRCNRCCRVGGRYSDLRLVQEEDYRRDVRNPPLAIFLEAPLDEQTE